MSVYHTANLAYVELLFPSQQRPQPLRRPSRLFAWKTPQGMSSRGWKGEYPGPKIEQCFSAGQAPPLPGHMTTSGDIFHRHDWVGMLASHGWRPGMRLTPGMLSHRHRPAPTAENYGVPNVNHASAEKPRRGEGVSGAIRVADFLPEEKHSFAVGNLKEGC